MDTAAKVKTALTIAGSDSGGGAGIQADLKAFARCGVHGTTAITAITAQNTVGVNYVEHTLPDAIISQVRAVVEDIDVHAVKIGMLGRKETVEAVSQALDLIDPKVPIVVDPVMVAESGAQLLEPAARSLLVKQILPRATVVTPNLPEAGVLAAQSSVSEVVDLPPAELAKAIHSLGPKTVVVTGGHRDKAVDLFYDGHQLIEIPGERYPDGAAHGSGCTHSSALAACLALGYSPLEAARKAKSLASEAVKNGLREIGEGAGPVDVFDLANTAKGSIV